MNCNHFRFLIQQSFDVELTSNDEQLVTTHLQSCASCQEFQHQLEQIIHSASKLPLSTDLLPENIERLALIISHELPKPKLAVLSLFTNIVDKIANGAKAIMQGIVSVPQKILQAFAGGKGQSQQQGEVTEEEAAESSRLRTLSRFLTHQPSSQTNTRSLGEKFGFGQTSAELQTTADEGSTNLAETIKRKLVEDKAKQEPSESIAQDTSSWETPAETQTSSNSSQSVTWGQLPSDAPQQEERSWSGTWDEPPAETGFVSDTPPLTSPESEQPSVSSTSIPTDSIINRLSNVLGETPGISTSADQLDANRFDIPIQERSKAAPPAAEQSLPPISESIIEPEPSPPPAAASQPSGSHWDMSIQEKLGQSAQTVEQTAEEGIFKNLKNTDMDKLFSENLGVNEKPQASPPPITPPTDTPKTMPAAAAPTDAQATPSEPVAPVQPVAQTPVSSSEPEGGIFKNIDDSAMDTLFNQNLGVREDVIKAQVKPGAQAPAKPKDDSLFAVDDQDIDKIFSDSLGVKEEANKQVQPKVVESTPSKKSDTKSPKPQATEPIKVEGIGKLDAKVDSSAGSGTGKIAAIGKFLLDQQDWTKISDLAKSDLTDSKMRILTEDAAKDVQALLQNVGQQAGVLGSVIVGHDGILIASSMPAEFDPESTGVLALGVYMNTNNTVKKLGHNQVHQIVSKTTKGYIIVADFGGGILVTLTDGAETEKLIPLMRSITQLVSS